jgi:hypothetical protein
MDEQRVETAEIKEVNYQATDWLIFLVSFTVLILLLLYASRYFWVALPFAGTYLVKALKMM